MRNFEPLKELLQNSGTFYLISVGMDSRYNYINGLYKQRFEPFYGDLVGQHYAITMHPEDTERCAEVAGLCFSNPGGIYPATVRKHDGEGGYIATQWDYKAMFDQEGSPLGIFCIGYDITTFIKTEIALKEIEHIQSHVIRKPLANLIGLVDLFDSSDTSGHISLVKMIRDSANELDQVVKSGRSMSG